MTQSFEIYDPYLSYLTRKMNLWRAYWEKGPENLVSFT